MVMLMLSQRLDQDHEPRQRHPWKEHLSRNRPPALSELCLHSHGQTHNSF